MWSCLQQLWSFDSWRTLPDRSGCVQRLGAGRVSMIVWVGYVGVMSFLRLLILTCSCMCSCMCCFLLVLQFGQDVPETHIRTFFIGLFCGGPVITWKIRRALGNNNGQCHHRPRNWAADSTGGWGRVWPQHKRREWTTRWELQHEYQWGANVGERMVYRDLSCGLCRSKCHTETVYIDRHSWWAFRVSATPAISARAILSDSSWLYYSPGKRNWILGDLS